ncbi:hypothetical protein [Derxia lacustris]|uniref:hypothetical protein n=1 Tax=Derxia lacustris TaxID=764842 RepID=UPI000A175990|nr:hypothetical protein [Derxia lacustris]
MKPSAAIASLALALVALAAPHGAAAQAGTASGRSFVLKPTPGPQLPGVEQPAPTKATLDAARQRLEDSAYAGVDLGRVVVEGFADRRSPEEILRNSLNKPDRPFRSLADRNGGLREDRDSFGQRNDCIAAQGPFACGGTPVVGMKSKAHWMDER